MPESFGRESQDFRPRTLADLAQQLAAFYRVELANMMAPRPGSNSPETRARREFCWRAHDGLGKSWGEIERFVARWHRVSRSTLARAGQRAREERGLAPLDTWPSRQVGRLIAPEARPW